MGLSYSETNSRVEVAYQIPISESTDILLEVSNSLEKSLKDGDIASPDRRIVRVLEETILNKVNHLIKKEDKDLNAEYGKVTYPYGIGNNKLYPIYIRKIKSSTLEEVGFLGYVFILNNMFGSEIVSFQNIDKKVITEGITFRER